jgi:site-specific recombinase XerD
MRTNRHSAKCTLRVRKRHVTKFLKWLGPEVRAEDLAGLTARQVEEFYLAYAQTAGDGERQSMQASLRTFFRFCLHEGHTEHHLDRAVPGWRSYRLSSVPKGLSEKQAQAVLDSIDRSTHAGCRDYAILQILHTYGVRGGQVRALRFKDVDWKANTIYFTALKRGKDSLLPLTIEVGQSLLDYIQNARPRCSFPQIFLTCRAPYGPLRESGCISSMVRNRLCSAGVNGSPKGSNAFRHGFATRMIKEGNSLKSIADVMGHRYLSTTHMYAKVDFDALKEVALEWPEEEI